DLREPACGSAIADDRRPVSRRLGSRLVAAVEVRKAVGLRETRFGFGSSVATGSVAGGAGGLVDVAARSQAEARREVLTAGQGRWIATLGCLHRRQQCGPDQRHGDRHPSGGSMSLRKRMLLF